MGNLVPSLIESGKWGNFVIGSIIGWCDWVSNQIYRRVEYHFLIGVKSISFSECVDLRSQIWRRSNDQVCAPLTWVELAPRLWSCLSVKHTVLSLCIWDDSVHHLFISPPMRVWDFHKQDGPSKPKAQKLNSSASHFCRQCDGHSNTLTVILDTNGNIFGCFTSVEWESGDWHCDTDYTRKTFLYAEKNEEEQRAFMFSMTAKQTRTVTFPFSMVTQWHRTARTKSKSSTEILLAYLSRISETQEFPKTKKEDEKRKTKKEKRKKEKKKKKEKKEKKKKEKGKKKKEKRTNSSNRRFSPSKLLDRTCK
jgi:hypothetical protein